MKRWTGLALALSVWLVPPLAAGTPEADVDRSGILWQFDTGG